MNTSRLKEIIVQQSLLYSNTNWIHRSKYDEIKDASSVLILSGIRRCGKSVLLQQIRNNNKARDFFLNFDDERLLHFSQDDFQLLYELFVELYGMQKIFYFDEIQNVKNWEYFVRRLHNEGNKVYITGSNANLLSKELGTHLTGRHIQVDLYPLSFKEYLDFENVDFLQKDFYTTEGKAKLKKHFSAYLYDGGFPEYLENKDIAYLKSLYDSILYRDIMVRNKIFNESEIRELGYFVASNISKPISYNNLKKTINVKHVNTVKKYLKYFEDTYLIFLLLKFDYSVKKQLINPKKIYFIDNALAKSISFRFSEDRGRFLENTVFLELKRRSHEIFYHKEKLECDFVIREKDKVVKAIQVTSSIENTETKKRELAGLLEAMKLYKLKEGLLLTEFEEDNIVEDGFSIKVLPIYKWLLS